MHDLEFEHLHVSAQDSAVNEVAWAADNVELTTVGIDIGSSTSHLMFARVHLQRLSTALVQFGDALTRAGNPDEAARQYAEAAELDPTNQAAREKAAAILKR